MLCRLTTADAAIPLFVIPAGTPPATPLASPLKPAQEADPAVVALVTQVTAGQHGIPIILATALGVPQKPPLTVATAVRHVNI